MITPKTLDFINDYSWSVSDITVVGEIKSMKKDDLIDSIKDFISNQVENENESGGDEMMSEDELNRMLSEINGRNIELIRTLICTTMLLLRG